MRLAFAVLFLSLPFIVHGQSSSVRALDPAAENRVKEILKGLESDNTLRFSLERGDRGEGIHYAWMDKMRQVGIKQASFVVGFEWKVRLRAAIEKVRKGLEVADSRGTITQEEVEQRLGKWLTE